MRYIGLDEDWHPQFSFTPEEARTLADIIGGNQPHFRDRQLAALMDAIQAALLAGADYGEHRRKEV